MRVCSQPGCPNLIPKPGRCPQHARTHEQQRGTRQQRGYDTEYDRARRAWAPKVATGTVTCWRCGNLISPSKPWQLGHNDDRTIIRGPEHQLCNLRAAGQAAHH